MLLEDGKQRVAANDYDGAAHCFVRAITTGRADAASWECVQEALLRLGVIYNGREDGIAAVEALSAALAIGEQLDAPAPALAPAQATGAESRTVYSAWRALSRARLSLRQYKGASEAAQRAAATRPDASGGYADWATAEAAAGSPSDVVMALYESGCAQYDADPSVRALLMVHCLDAGATAAGHIDQDGASAATAVTLFRRAFELQELLGAADVGADGLEPLLAAARDFVRAHFVPSSGGAAAGGGADGEVRNAEHWEEATEGDGGDEYTEEGADTTQAAGGGGHGEPRLAPIAKGAFKLLRSLCPDAFKVAAEALECCSGLDVAISYDLSMSIIKAGQTAGSWGAATLPVHLQRIMDGRRPATLGALNVALEFLAVDDCKPVQQDGTAVLRHGVAAVRAAAAAGTLHGGGAAADGAFPDDIFAGKRAISGGVLADLISRPVQRVRVIAALVGLLRAGNVTTDTPTMLLAEGAAVMIGPSSARFRVNPARRCQRGEADVKFCEIVDRCHEFQIQRLFAVTTDWDVAPLVLAHVSQPRWSVNDNFDIFQAVAPVAVPGAPRRVGHMMSLRAVYHALMGGPADDDESDGGGEGERAGGGPRYGSLSNVIDLLLLMGNDALPHLVGVGNERWVASCARLARRTTEMDLTTELDFAALVADVTGGDAENVELRACAAALRGAVAAVREYNERADFPDCDSYALDAEGICVFRVPDHAAVTSLYGRKLTVPGGLVRRRAAGGARGRRRAGACSDGDDSDDAAETPSARPVFRRAAPLAAAADDEEEEEEDEDGAGGASSPPPAAAPRPRGRAHVRGHLVADALQEGDVVLVL